MSIVFLGDNSMSEPITSIQMYSDSTPMVKTLGWPRIVDRAHTVVVRGGGLANFVTAMFLVDAVETGGGKIKTLILPYIPGARQDRSNPTGDVLFTIHSVAKMINERNFAQVIVVDPHSPEAAFQIDRMVEYPLTKVAERLSLPGGRAFDGIIVPDKGAKARAEMFAEALGLPIYFGGKTRDVSTGRLSGFTLEFIPYNGHYLVVDDICDGGGTFVGLADKIREQGSTADLYVTHGIFSKGTRDLLEAYNHIYTTDSLLAGSERGKNVTVLAVVKEMEKYNEG